MNHGLSCQHSVGLLPYHTSANETICHTLVSDGVPAVLEPVGVCHEDGKQPNGMSLIPWWRGLLLLWDLTLWPHVTLLLQFMGQGGWQIVPRLKRGESILP